jgi:glycosyltransferase involved in cell wall biosynthesis
MNSLIQGAAKQLIRTATWNWKPYSRLILYGDSVGWSLDWDMRELANISRRLGVRIARPIWKHAATPQSIFYASQFFLTDDDWLKLLPHHIGFSYFHGAPGTGEDDFDAVYDGLKKHHDKLARIQVSHTEMRDIVLRTGIDPAKVFMIPIGINLGFFPFRTVEVKRSARVELGVPHSAFVVGSFQKDGVGWDDGLEPKLVKGPDIFVETMKRLKRDIPELFVMLSGPSRGYVKQGLEAADIPYLHVYLQSYPEIAKLYQALDLYVVSSRQEGGPKAVLESMATGVPLVTTRVGQAMDLVTHGENAFMTKVEDVDALASYALQVYRSSQSDLQPMLTAGRKTAEANSYESQLPLWADFMKGFVE